MGPLKNAFHHSSEACLCDTKYAIIIIFLYPLHKTHRRSCELSQQTVDNIRIWHQLSFKENDEAQGENMEEGMKVVDSMVGLFYKMAWSFFAKVEPDIKGWGENGEYAEVNDIQKTVFWGQVRYVSP